MDFDQERTIKLYQELAEAREKIASLTAYAEELREYVAMVSTYEGSDPLTTDYREIVRDLGRWARELLAKKPNAAEGEIKNG